MKFNNVMLITLLLLAVLTIGAVSAADNLTEDILQEDSSDNVELNDDIISSVQEEVIGDDGGTFTALKNKIQGAGDNATINLENDYVYDGSETISISKAIIINGNGHKIDGNSQSSAFILTAKVTLENITFVHCSGKYGGAVSIDSSASDCNIISCNFIDCTGVSLYGTYPSPNDGGAILNWGGNTNIESCTFVNCSSYNGGAILSSASNCKITSCDFRNCHVANQGGAISSDVECIIDSCNFTNCVSDNKGGAIFNAGETNINSCIFTNCSAYTGNVIHNQRGNTKVKNSNFVDLAKSKVSTSESGSVDFTDCTFNDPVPQYKYVVRVYEDSFIFNQNNADYYPVQIGYVIVPPTLSEGKLVVSDGAKILFSSLITDTYYWDVYESEKSCSIFIGYLNFNGVNNDDVVRFAFLDGNNTEVIYKDYFICFNGDYVKFELYNDSAEKADPNLTINVGDVDYGSDVLVEITTNETFSGEVSVQIENGIYPVVVTNGYGNKTISNLNSGKHTANAVFKATRLFKDSNAETNFTINKIDSSVNVSDIELDYGTSKNVEVITVGATGFTAKIDGEDAVVDDNKIVVSGLSIGNHTLSITTNPDINHNSVTKNVTITVNKVNIPVVVPDITFDYGASGTSTVTGASKINATVNSEKAIVSVKDNVITVSGLDAGTFTLTVKAVDSNNENVTKEATITVNKVDSAVIVKSITFDYGASGSTDVALTGANGFNATVVGYPKSIAVDGNKITVSGLGAGTYTLSVTANPDVNHNGVTKNVTVTVKQLKTTVSAPKVSVIYGNSKNIVVTLKDANGKLLEGKKVTVKLNGVAYNDKVTNSKGQISIAVPKTLAVKTYSASLVFEGDKNYIKSDGKVSVVVSKATPKLTAGAKSIKKSDKSKKYTVTLKVNNKVMKSTKLTITVNKKTYTAKTNSKGQATFKLTKLTKKGKYTALVKYAGSGNYKAVTAKPKITIK